MFLSFFRLMLPIALFQRSPADLPHSSALCFWAITWAFVLSVSADVLMGYDAGFGIVRLVLSLLIYGLLLLVVLRLVNKKPRFLQTYTASVGAGATLLVLMVFVGLLMQLGFTEEELFGLMLGVVLWSIFVDGFILSKALEIHRVPATALAFTIAIVQLVLLPADPGAT